MPERNKAMKRPKNGPQNANSRAVVAALQSDYVDLRAAALGIIESAITTDESRPLRALMIELDCARNTAIRIQALAKTAKRRKAC